MRDFKQENNQVKISSQKNILEVGKRFKAMIRETIQNCGEENRERVGKTHKRESESNVN